MDDDNDEKQQQTDEKSQRELELEKELKRLKKRLKKEKKKAKKVAETPPRTDKKERAKDEEETKKEADDEEEEKEQDDAEKRIAEKDQPEEEEGKEEEEEEEDDATKSKEEEKKKKKTTTKDEEESEEGESAFERVVSAKDERHLLALVYRSMLIKQAQNFPPNRKFDWSSLLDDDDLESSSSKTRRIARRKHNDADADDEEEEEEEASFTEESDSDQMEDLVSDSGDDDTKNDSSSSSPSHPPARSIEKEERALPSRVLPERAKRRQAATQIAKTIQVLKDKRAGIAQQQPDLVLLSSSKKMNREAEPASREQLFQRIRAKMLGTVAPPLSPQQRQQQEQETKVFTNTSKEAWRDPLKTLKQQILQPPSKTPLPAPSSTGKKTVVAEFQRGSSRGEESFDFEQHSSEGENHNKRPGATPPLVVYDQQQTTAIVGPGRGKKPQAAKKVSAHTEALVAHDSQQSQGRHQVVLHTDAQKVSIELNTRDVINEISQISERIGRLGTKRSSSEVDLALVLSGADSSSSAKRRRLLDPETLSHDSTTTRRFNPLSPEADPHGSLSNSGSNSLSPATISDTLSLEDKMRLQLRFWWDWRNPAFVASVNTMRAEIEKLAANRFGGELRDQHKKYETVRLIGEWFQREKNHCLDLASAYFQDAKDQKNYGRLIDLVNRVKGFSSFTKTNMSSTAVGAEVTCRITETDISINQAVKCTFEFPPSRNKAREEYYVCHEWQTHLTAVINLKHHPLIVTYSSFTGHTDPDQCITPELVNKEVARIRNCFRYFYTLFNQGTGGRARALTNSLLGALERSGWLAKEQQQQQQALE